MWSAQSGRRRQRQAARDKDDLLSAAAKVIATRGLDQTRFTDVSEATGVAISTLQYYFGCREDLLLAVIEHALEEDLRRLRAIAQQTPDPRERLALLLALAMGDADGYRESRLLWVEVWRAGFRDAEVRSLFFQRYEAWLELLRETLQQGMQQAVFAADISAYDAAVQILACIDGLATPLLVEAPELDVSRARQLASDVIASVLKIDQPLPEIA